MGIPGKPEMMSYKNPFRLSKMEKVKKKIFLENPLAVYFGYSLIPGNPATWSCCMVWVGLSFLVSGTVMCVIGFGTTPDYFYSLKVVGPIFMCLGILSTICGCIISFFLSKNTKKCETLLPNQIKIDGNIITVRNASQTPATIPVYQTMLFSSKNPNNEGQYTSCFSNQNYCVFTPPSPNYPA